MIASHDLPDLKAGVYKHYKGPLYLVLGYAHDANADALWDRAAVDSLLDRLHGLDAPRLRGHLTTRETRPEPLSERIVVVYIGLQLDDAHEGPRLAVREVADFLLDVCHVLICPKYGKRDVAPDTVLCVGCGEKPKPRFTYVGPSYSLAA